MTKKWKDKPVTVSLAALMELQGQLDRLRQLAWQVEFDRAQRQRASQERLKVRQFLGKA